MRLLCVWCLGVLVDVSWAFSLSPWSPHSCPKAKLIRHPRTRICSAASASEGEGEGEDQACQPSQAIPADELGEAASDARSPSPVAALQIPEGHVQAMKKYTAEESAKVEWANLEFYLALSHKDKRKMAAVWLDDDRSQCIHPATQNLMGYEKVQRWYRGLFANRDPMFRKCKVVPRDVKVNVRGRTAWVTCREEVRIPVPGGRQERFATNVFSKVRGKWYLASHHTSQLSNPSIGSLLGGLGGQIGGARVISLSQLKGESDGGSLDDIVNGIRDAIAEQVESSGQGSNQRGIVIGGSGLSSGLLGAGVMDDDDDDEEDEDEEIEREAARRSKASEMAKRTVVAVRKAVSEGLLSEGEKQCILADVINRASCGETSVIETAFVLLVPGGEEELVDAELEDFAAQCRIFCASVEVA